MESQTFELTDDQQKILECKDYLLIKGGPGSGKTTIAIIKAAQIAKYELKNYQRILFLSFARATVSRVLEAIDEYKIIDSEIKRRIEVETYHSFFWSIIKTHGYLLGMPRNLSILTPSNESIVLANIRNEYEKGNQLSDYLKKEKEDKEMAARNKLAFTKGRISFELFAELSFSLLSNSKKILNLINTCYPYIILDEFQDTNLSQWNVVKSLGQNSTLIALADPEQRIFDFIGAHPERLDHFQLEFSPKVIDLKDNNFRSSGTDILKFGNDILSGNFLRNYIDVSVIRFPSNQNQAFAKLKAQTIQSRRRLIDKGIMNWTLAILVPTKKLMRQVSDCFNVQDRLPIIHHQAAFDKHGAILSAEIIAFLLQPNQGPHDEAQFIDLLCNFLNGKGGETPTRSNLNIAVKIKKDYEKSTGLFLFEGSIPYSSNISSIINTYYQIRKLSYSGSPINDWITVRNILESSSSESLRNVAAEAKNLRLLNRGTQLRDALFQNWIDNGCYLNALDIVRQSFLIEHFATSQKIENGVIVMNMHKAKGKQFDEVIIFEGWPIKKNNIIVSNLDRIVRGNIENKDIMNAKYNLRVSVTRAKLHTTIMTPADDPCILFL